MPRTVSRIVLDAIAVILGLIFAAGAGELALRWFWPQRSDVTIGMFRGDPDAGYRLRAGYRNYVRVPEYRVDIRTDAQGYRVPVAGTPESETASRILVIGDSFTFGVGVNAEDAFPEVLESRLDAAAPGAWEVRNGGVGGYGPLRSARLLAARQASWNPDVLVHAIYVGNDLEDDAPDRFLEAPRIENGRMVSARKHRLQAWRLYLRTHSHLYAFLRDRFYGLYQRSALAEGSQYLDPMGLSEWTASIREKSWPAAQRSIAEIAAWCRDHDVDHLVVLVPSRWQVDDASWESYRAAWALPDDAFDRDRAQRVLTEYLDDLGVPVLDLLPEFRRAAAEGARLYYTADRHWTPAGHVLAGRRLAEELDRLGWLSAPGRELVRAGSPTDR